MASCRQNREDMPLSLAVFFGLLIDLTLIKKNTLYIVVYKQNVQNSTFLISDEYELFLPVLDYVSNFSNIPVQ